MARRATPPPDLRGHSRASVHARHRGVYHHLLAGTPRHAGRRRLGGVDIPSLLVLRGDLPWARARALPGGRWVSDDRARALAAEPPEVARSARDRAGRAGLAELRRGPHGLGYHQ